MIMPGISIGNGAIIAARAVIVKDVAPYEIVGGNPALHIRYRFSNEEIEQLQNIKWWNWQEEKVKENMRFICSANIKALVNLNT